ncbi:MAG: prepilin-type N-terminal cleavage/methylation domain-containing protein [Candidatus Hydrogenedentes bacterium]|nr:prepilin-type N-terminal cleavage/methylation domain-containing protein [Candidatus Hydrogenedentota bacterium]
MSRAFLQNVRVHGQEYPTPSFPRKWESRTRQGFPKTTLDPRVCGDDDPLSRSDCQRLRATDITHARYRPTLPPSKNHCGGFTLVELLVATMLLTIVMTAVYTLFFTVIQSWRSIENDHGHHRKSRNVLALIQREYDNVFAPAAYLMEGTPHELTLFVVAPPMQSEDSSGPHLMRVRYRYNPRQGELEREEALIEAALPPFIPDPDSFDRGRIQLKQPNSFVVARGLKDFDFRYVWMPQPDSSYWRNAPVPVEPLIASYHRLKWGFPQALDIRLTYQDEEDTPPYVAEVRFPTRTSTLRRERYQLENILGDAL